TIETKPDVGTRLVGISKHDVAVGGGRESRAVTESEEPSALDAGHHETETEIGVPVRQAPSVVVLESRGIPTEGVFKRGSIATGIGHTPEAVLRQGHLHSERESGMGRDVDQRAGGD